MVALVIIGLIIYFLPRKQRRVQRPSLPTKTTSDAELRRNRALIEAEKLRDQARARNRRRKIPIVATPRKVSSVTSKQIVTGNPSPSYQSVDEYPSTSNNDDSILAAVAIASVILKDDRPSTVDTTTPRYDPPDTGGGDFGGGGASGSWSDDSSSSSSDF